MKNRRGWLPGVLLLGLVLAVWLVMQFNKGGMKEFVDALMSLYSVCIGGLLVGAIIKKVIMPNFGTYFMERYLTSRTAKPNMDADRLLAITDELRDIVPQLLRHGDDWTVELDDLVITDKGFEVWIEIIRNKDPYAIRDRFKLPYMRQPLSAETYYWNKQWHAGSGGVPCQVAQQLLETVQLANFHIVS